MIVQHANEAFRNQGFTDVGLEPWTPSKSNKDEGRAVLVKSGRLRHSIRVVNTTPDSVTVGTDVPYAQVYNEGFDGQVNVSSHSRFTTGKLKVSSFKTKNLEL